MSELSNQEKRQDRLEEAIDRLTSISYDLSKMIAVHEQRIIQQEKVTDSLELIFERRREEMDKKIEDIYDTIKSEDKSILSEIDKISKKINDIEKFMWTSVGSLTILMLMITEGPNILKMFLR